jgi:hypothetical protein
MPHEERSHRNSAHFAGRKERVRALSTTTSDSDSDSESLLKARLVAASVRLVHTEIAP